MFAQTLEHSLKNLQNVELALQTLFDKESRFRSLREHSNNVLMSPTMQNTNSET